MNEQARFCAACGSAVPPGATFCPRCGTTVPGGQAAPFVAGPGFAPGPRGSVGGMQGVPPTWAAGAEIASPGLRVLSWLVEMLVVWMITAAATAAFTGAAASRTLWGALGYQQGSLVQSFLPQAVVLIWGIVTWIWEGRTGRRVGNVVTGTRTVDAATGAAPGLGRIFLSRIVLGAINVAVTIVGGLVSVFVLGPLAALAATLVGAAATLAVAGTGTFDKGPLRQGWHEKASGTTVVRSRAGSSVGPVTAPVALPVPPMAAPPAPVPTALPVQPPVPAPAPMSMPAPAPVPAAMPMPAPAPVTPVVAVPPVAAVPPAVPFVAPPAQGLIAEVPGFSPAPAEPSDVVAPAAPVRPAEPDAADDDLVHTRLSPRAARRGGHRLAFDTGEVVHVTGRGMVGRAPEASPGEHVEHLVAIADPDMSVSKTHLAFGADAAGLWVEDQGSTNGTELIAPGAAPELVPAGRRVLVPDGATVRFGERSFVVRTS